MAKIDISRGLSFGELVKLLQSNNVNPGDPLAIQEKYEGEERFIIGRYHNIENSRPVSIYLRDALKITYPYEGMTVSREGWLIQYPRTIQHYGPFKKCMKDVGYIFQGTKLLITTPEEIIEELDKSGLVCISNAFREYL